MRQRLCRRITLILIVTMLVSLGAAMACDLYDAHCRGFMQGPPSTPTPAQQTAQQLQFGVPTPTLVEAPIEWAPGYPWL